MWSVYCLQTLDRKHNQKQKTYIGATLDVHRRLKQHNGLLSGGAKATKGRIWTRICHVTGFPNERSALQFEWAWKYMSRKVDGSYLQKRFQALQYLISLEKATSKADPMPEVVVIWESELDPFLYF